MRTPYNEPGVGTMAASAPNMSLNTIASDDSRLMRWAALSMLLHMALVLLTWLTIVVMEFFGFSVPWFDPLALKPREVEFVLVDHSPEAPPRDPNTKNRAERMSRSGGEQTAKKAVALPQQAAGAAGPTPQPQPQPQAKPQPQRTAQPTRPAQKQASQQPTQQTPAKKPAPRPPAPKAPAPTKVASVNPSLPPNPVGAIKAPTPPPNPGAARGGGPVSRTASNSGSSGGGGNPGPSTIAGRPSSNSASGGGGGAGGTGAYNQSGSPGGGGGRAGIDALPEPDFGPYIAELQRRIRKNWNPPTADRSKRVVAMFTVSRDGRLLNYRIKQSSGTSVADDAAVAAITASAPFRPLPANFRGNDIDVEFIFDYEIYGGGGSAQRR